MPLKLETLVVESFATAPSLQSLQVTLDTVRQCIASHRITCEISCNGTC
ncbi:MAG TPA: hypothetical protein VF092_15085 [Longimicrobium sp.]